MATTQYQRDFVSQIEPSVLGRAICSVDDRCRKILSQRLIRQEPKTLKQLSKELNISIERVRQIQTVAFERVRRSLDEASIKSQV